jgi:type IV secretory pathway VirJ component
MNSISIYKKSILIFTFIKIIFPFQEIFSQNQSLPIITEYRGTNTRPMIFEITGDGGWRGFDIKMSLEYKANNFSYIFLNSIKYFWTTKTPEQLAQDITPTLRSYLKAWNKQDMILVGFSFGAEILPFMLNELPEDLKQKVKMIVMITPAKSSDFDVHLTDMMGVDHKYKYDVIKEVEKITATKVLCIYGDKESSIFKEPINQKNLKVEYIKGGHHFTDGKSTMEIILNELNKNE